MKLRYRLAQAASLFVALASGVLAMTCAARAVVTVTTPNTTQVTFNLSSGITSGPIATPATDQATLIVGVCTSTGSSGVGHIALLHRSGGGISWTGRSSNGIVTSGSGVSTAGSLIMALDSFSQVSIEVHDGDNLQIHNASAGSRIGQMRLMW